MVDHYKSIYSRVIKLLFSNVSYNKQTNWILESASIYLYLSNMLTNPRAEAETIHSSPNAFFSNILK